MFENLESRQFMSATLLASDVVVVPEPADPTTVVVVTAKVKPSDIPIVIRVDKPSPKIF